MLEPHATVELPITETQALQDTYQIFLITPKEAEFFYSRKYIDDATKNQLDKLVETSAQMKSLDEKNKKLDDEISSIEDDQKRLRENIEKLNGTVEAKQLITRYIAKADAQESRLEQIEKEQKNAESEKEQLRIQFTAAVKEFKFDRKL